METSDMQGLSTAQADALRARGDANELPRDAGGVGEILKRNVLTLFNLLNLVLAGLLIAVGEYRNMLFMGVVLSNALIGTVQELRAKRTHDRLKLLSEGRVRVLRDGRECALSPSELVLGDVVFLSRGDQVPADAVVLCGTAQADESLLTGESRAVDKTVDSRLFSGSFLLSGGVTARLVAVGVHSYAGRLQQEARRVKRASSELMVNMRLIIRGVSVAIVPIGLALFWRHYSGLELALPESVTRAVASVVGMIPEGLMLLTSMALAVGVVKLGRRKALVNELYGIETLARTDVVCMDKTGTLTSGDMSLCDVLPLEGHTREEVERLAGAMAHAFAESTPTLEALRRALPRGMEAPLQTVAFSSDRKWSAARFDGPGTVVMGAPEKLLRGADLETAKARAAQGLRVMALLQAGDSLAGEGLPETLQPVGLLCLSDALRPHVRDTVRYFGQQGVTLKVISGDSPLTVSRVAKDAGVPDAERYVDLSALGETKDYAALARDYAVYGRVSPEDKRELVAALRQAGHGVAMVGDGVNDIPALKAANCSIAMAGGSDAAGRVAQITLLDPDFNILPDIVLEGRRVINNITRSASLFLIKNIFSFLISILTLALPVAYPFAPIQLTLVSTLTIGVPSFVLALQPSNERVSGSFLRNVVMRALPGGLCATVLVAAMLCLCPVLGLNHETASTLSTLVAGYSGLVALTLTCLPLDALRGGLVAAMAGLFCLLVGLWPQVFYLEPVQGVQWLLLLGAAVFAPAAQVSLGAWIRRGASRGVSSPARWDA